MERVASFKCAEECAFCVTNDVKVTILAESGARFFERFLDLDAAGEDVVCEGLEDEFLLLGEALFL